MPKRGTRHPRRAPPQRPHTGLVTWSEHANDESGRDPKPTAKNHPPAATGWPPHCRRNEGCRHHHRPGDTVLGTAREARGTLDTTATSTTASRDPCLEPAPPPPPHSQDTTARAVPKAQPCAGSRTSSPRRHKQHAVVPPQPLGVNGILFRPRLITQYFLCIMRILQFL